MSSHNIYKNKNDLRDLMNHEVRMILIEKAISTIEKELEQLNKILDKK